MLHAPAGQHFVFLEHPRHAQAKQILGNWEASDEGGSAFLSRGQSRAKRSLHVGKSIIRTQNGNKESCIFPRKTEGLLRNLVQSAWPSKKKHFRGLTGLCWPPSAEGSDCSSGPSCPTRAARTKRVGFQPPLVSSCHPPQAALKSSHERNRVTF